MMMCECFYSGLVVGPEFTYELYLDDQMRSICSLSEEGRTSQSVTRCMSHERKSKALYRFLRSSWACLSGLHVDTYLRELPGRRFVFKTLR
jgi:hypothetical protein